MRVSWRVVVMAAAMFGVAVVSLYHMLELLQSERRAPDSPQNNLPLLQQRVDRLERLLVDNNALVAQIRDSLISAKGGGVWIEDQRDNGTLLARPFQKEDCQFARESRKVSTATKDIQLLDVYQILDFENPDGGVWKQGFDISYQGDEWNQQPLEVFVIPHSHNDPGWLKTFDNYYRDQTQHILNNMVVKLSQDNRRKMIWSEISFFSKWWEDIDVQKRDAVKRLLGNGQLEIVTGGWVMPDEANCHYFAILDQLVEGHQWLQLHLGIKPTNGWAIDPFGHSPSMAYFLKKAGLSNMVIQRIHYAVKKQFSAQKTLEFYWRQNWEPTPSRDILCHMMPFYSYDVPHTCGPDPKVCCQFDFKRLPGGRISCPWRVQPQQITVDNVKERAELLLDQYRKKSMLFRSNVLLVPLGDDFRYSDASEFDQQFENYQKIFDHFHEHPELHVKAQFGTLSDYFSALRRQQGSTGMELPTLRGDFFTYADRDDHYWSGYFTSRPFYKHLDRVLEGHLRAAEVLYSLTLAERRATGNHGDGFPATECYRLLMVARRNLGLFQHHDAVAGTGRDPVMADYGTRLFHSILNVKQVLLNSAHWLVLEEKTSYSYNPSKAFLQMDEIQPSQDALPRKTVLKITAEPRSLIIFNPIGQQRSTIVSVYINEPSVRVVDVETGRPVTAQISAVWEEPTRVSKEAFQLSFIAEVPPFALAVYQLIGGPGEGSAQQAEYALLRGGRAVPPPVSAENFKLSTEGSGPLSLRNAHIQTWSSAQDGLLEKVQLLDEDLVQQVQVKFFWYGTTSNRDKSGAYLFLPDGEAKLYSHSQPPLIRVTRGSVFSDITSYFQHVTHTLRLFHVEGTEGGSIQLSNHVDIRSEVNRELVMRLISDVASGERFYSDLNGFQIQPRRTMAKIPLQANFYPMTSMAFIQDAKSRLSLLTSQSLGVASLKPGQLEVVLDRRLIQDDNRGLAQGVTDNKLTTSMFSLLLERRRGSQEEDKISPVIFPSITAHLSSHLLCHPLIIMAMVSALSPLLQSYQPMSSSLPCDVHLVNLRSLQDMDGQSPSESSALILHRNVFDCDLMTMHKHTHCHTTQGQVNLDGLFSSLRFREVQSTSLTFTDHLDRGPAHQQNHHIRLDPMEVAAFRVKIS